MGKQGESKSLKRSMTRGWQISKKQYKFTVKNKCGPHSANNSLSLIVVIRDLIKLTNTYKETKNLLNAGNVLIDSKKRSDPQFSVGIMDTISIPEEKLFYRLLPKKNVLTLVKIEKKESTTKLCKIESKHTTKNGLLQYCLNDGRNIISDNKYKVGDTLKIELPTQKILASFPIVKDSYILVLKGKLSGKIGIIESQTAGTFSRKSMLNVKFDNVVTELPADISFSIGKDKSQLPLEYSD